MRLAWVLIATVALGAARAPAADPVTATMKVAGGKAVVELGIASGWHVQAHDPTDKFLIPTTLDLTVGDEATDESLSKKLLNYIPSKKCDTDFLMSFCL